MMMMMTVTMMTASDGEGDGGRGAARRGGCPVQSMCVASPRQRAGPRLPPAAWAMLASLVLALQDSVRKTIVALGA